MNVEARPVPVRNRHAAAAHQKCAHPSAREIRLYVAYSEAVMARARIAQQPSERIQVSKLYAIPGGWGWSMCRDCAKS
jgi:hypothetical protein